MTQSLLLLALLLAPPQSAQQLRSEIRQLESRMSSQQDEIARLAATIESQTPLCASEFQPVDGVQVKALGGEDGTRVLLNLVSVVGTPSNRCLPATVSVTASYLDQTGNLVCSGTVERIATQTSLTGSVNLELQPWNLTDFVLWLNEPPRQASGTKRLPCFSADGKFEVATLPSETASLWLRVSLFPAGGGLATSEFRIDMR